MAISVNEARQVTLHCREGATATPLYPVTSADVVAYHNGSAGFTGETTRAALDELFRRLGVVEGEVLPPVIAVPELLSPEAGTLVAEGEELTLTSTSFAMSSGKDTHTASEWRISGADGRQLWSSGESADRLESFPGLAVNRETLPDVTGVPDGEGLTLGVFSAFSFLFGSSSLMKTAEGDGALLCWEGDSQDCELQMVTRSEDGGKLWARTACTDATVFSDIVWTGTRFLAFPKSTSSTLPVMASTDRGDTWTQVSSLPFKNQYCAVRAAVLEGVLVAVTRTSTLYRSEDDGATWSAVTCPIAARSLFTAHGHFVGYDGGASWVASADGQNWFPIAALEGMTAVTADAVGLVGICQENAGVSFVRVSGENFQTTDKPKARFGFAFELSEDFGCCLYHDAANGLYVLLIINNRTFDESLTVLWYGTAFPESAESSPLLSDAGWTGMPLATLLPGLNSFSSPVVLSFRGQDYLEIKMSGDADAGWQYPSSSVMGLRVEMVGKLLSEQLLASVRHKGERAGWSGWAADVPFTAELGTGSAAGTAGLEQQDGLTFCTRGQTSYGTLLETEFTVPDGVTELLVLCVSAVKSSSQPGRAASCRIAVTPGQVIPVSVGGYNTTSKTVVTTSSFGGFISCDPSGITCPSGTLMEFQGANGYSTTRKGGGLAFLTDDEWRNFALYGTDQQPTVATSVAYGLNVGWNGFTYMYSFCGGTSAVSGQSGIIKVWWGQQIAG